MGGGRDLGGVGKAASERRGNNLNRFKDFCLKAKAQSWPWLSYMSRVRSTAGLNNCVVGRVSGEVLIGSDLGVLEELRQTRIWSWCSGKTA